MSVTAVPLRPIARGALPKLWIGLVLIAILAVLLALAGTGSIRERFASDADFLAENAGEVGVQTTDSGLQYRVVAQGAGEPPVEGQLIRIAYTGRLRDGTVFDENAGAPMLVGATIPGFTEALKMMPQGAKYEIWIPSDLAYGPEGSRDPQTGEQVIPENAMLNFDVEVLDILSLEDSQKILAGEVPEGMGGATGE